MRFGTLEAKPPRIRASGYSARHRRKRSSWHRTAIGDALRLPETKPRLSGFIVTHHCRPDAGTGTCRTATRLPQGAAGAGRGPSPLHGRHDGYTVRLRLRGPGKAEHRNGRSTPETHTKLGYSRRCHVSVTMFPKMPARCPRTNAMSVKNTVYNRPRGAQPAHRLCTILSTGPVFQLYRNALQASCLAEYFRRSGKQKSNSSMLKKFAPIWRR